MHLSTLYVVGMSFNCYADMLAWVLSDFNYIPGAIS